MKKTISVLGLVCLAALTGCTKQKECSETIDTINATVERFDKMDANMDLSNPAKAAEQMKKLSKAVEEEAEKINKLKPETEELKKHVEDYQAMVNDMAKATKKLAEAAKSMAELEKGMEKSQKDLTAAMTAVNGACTTNAKGCAEIAAKLQQAPTGNEGDEVFLKKLEAFGGELKGIKPGDAKVAGPLGQLVKAVDGQVALLKKAKATEKAGEEAATALDKATDAEDGLVSAINTFCGAP